MEVISIKSKENLDYLLCITEIYLYEKYNIMNAVYAKKDSNYHYICIDEKYFDKAVEAISHWIIKTAAFIFSIDIMDNELENLPYEFKYETVRKLQNIQQEAEEEKIKHKLIGFSKITKQISFEGFIKFAAPEHLNKLYNKMLEYIEQPDAEYCKITELIKTYIDTEICRTNELNVLNKNNCYIFLDENKDNITDQCLNEFVKEFGKTYNQNDLLIGVLLQRLPKKINIIGKSDENPNAFITIKNLFPGRVLFVDSNKIDFN